MGSPIGDRLERHSIEYNLTEHCNLSCYSCDHASPLLPTKFARLEDFSRDLTALARVFHASQLRILGGEPLLHPELPFFLAEARRIGIADRIAIFTNGVRLHQAPDELWDLIDELWISVYPGVARRLSDDACARICKAHGVSLHISHWVEFGKTLINQRIENPALVKAIFRECKSADCHTVHEGRFYRCCVAPFTRQRLALRGIDFDNHAIDGVALHDNVNLYEDLDACLNGRSPLAACSFCLGTSGPMVQHRQLNQRGRTMWLEEDARPDIEAVELRLLARSYRVKAWIRDNVRRVRSFLRLRSRFRGLLRQARGAYGHTE